MKRIDLTLIILCLYATTATAQFPTLEFYGGIGAFSTPNESFTEVSTGPQFVGSGEGFFLQQQGTQTVSTSTEYESGQSIQFGAEGHYAVGKYGSVYAGFRVHAAMFNYRSGDTSFETMTAGPVDTVFFEVGGGVIGDPINFCPTSSLSFGDNRPNHAFALDVGIPIGYRHRFFNDRIGLRVQGSVNVPLLGRHTAQNLVLRQDAAQNCLRFEEANANASSAYGLNTFVFRAGGGVDFALGHSFSLGLLVEQQLNSTFKTNASFVVDEGNFISVPEISDFRPLNISLVGRFVIR